MSKKLDDPILFERTKEIMTLHSQEFANYFYQELLLAHSDLATGFRNTDISKQKEKLLDGVAQIFTLLDNEKKLSQYLYDLGIRHICYEVTEEHYPIVRNVLLKSVKHIHQSEWNQKYENWWSAVITTIIDHMMAGCRRIREAS